MNRIDAEGDGCAFDCLISAAAEAPAIPVKKARRRESCNAGVCPNEFFGKHRASYARPRASRITISSRRQFNLGSDCLGQH